MTRIRNHYLVSILSVLGGLGFKNVSQQVLVEAWQSKGGTCDDIFFLHLDTLRQYSFVETNEVDDGLITFSSTLSDATPEPFVSQDSAVEPTLWLEKMLNPKPENDKLLSMTHGGVEFLNRYGR